MIRLSARLRFSARLPAVALAFAFGAAGCGDSEPAPASPDETQAPLRATADDPGARELLGRIRTRVEQGTGLGDAAWGQDLAFLGRLLWPAEGDAGDQRNAQVHADLATVAGDVGRGLVRKSEARADWKPALDLEIHDAWLAAADHDPAAYRTWVEGAGARLIQRLRQDRAKLFEGR